MTAAHQIDDNIRHLVHPVHAAVLRAYDAGLCPVRASTDGTKRPVGSWERYQASRPTRAQLDAWFGDGHQGWGIICGAVSGGVEMLELEGRAVEDGMWDEFCAAADKAGVGHVLDRIANGYGEDTPSGGIHLLLRVTDGPALGNMKLARRKVGDDTQVLFETRGEKGFAILAPSHGPTHPTGMPWELMSGSLDTIAQVTCAERDALYDVARSFNTLPDKVRPIEQGNVKPAPYQATSESWISDVVAELAREPWGSILGRYGWQYHHDGGDITYWTRPGKDPKDGWSATTNAKGSDRLIVFSSSTPFDDAGSATQAPSYDRLDVIATYDHGGNRIEAARQIAGRPATPAAFKIPRHIDPETGEIIASESRYLDDQFWNARPWLTHIRDTARRRMVAPAAVLGCILARVAAFTPPSVRIPAIIGTESPLSTFVALRARSGGGKSSANGCAADLLPIVPAGCHGPLPLGSGEGLIDAYFDLVEDENAAGKKMRIKRQTRHGVLFNLDEGGALAEMANRKGSTILPTLRTAWSGGDLGQTNASIETRRNIKAGQYAIGLVSLWQDHAAARLLDDVDGGTPQRFLFIDTSDPDADETQWSGGGVEPLDWTPPPIVVRGGLMASSPLEVHPDIVAEIRDAHLAVLRGQATVDPLSTHRRLLKLKLAGLFAVIERRRDIGVDDWELAERLVAHSDDVRTWIGAEAARRRQEADRTQVTKHVAREAAVQENAARQSLDRAAKAVARVAARKAPGTFTKRDAHAAVSGRDRAVVTILEAIDEAERLRWVVQVADGEWKAGDARPS